MMLHTANTAHKAQPRAARRATLAAADYPAMRVFKNPLYNPKAAKAQGHSRPKTAKPGQTTASDIHLACKEAA